MRFPSLPIFSVLAALVISAASAGAATIDFGTSWAAWGNAYYTTSPGNRVIGIDGGTHSNESDVAAVLNAKAGTTFLAADINKTNSVTELGGTDGYFAVPGGWDWLVVQYDGPNGGSAVIRLDGNDAKVPYDSSVLWGTGDQYGVSHYSVAGVHVTSSQTPAVPDGGTTISLFGLGLMSVALLRRKFAK
jgi:hypothetical protein